MNQFLVNWSRYYERKYRITNKQNSNSTPMLIYRYNGNDPKFHRYTMRKWFLPMILVLVLIQVFGSMLLKWLPEFEYGSQIGTGMIILAFFIVAAVLSDIRFIYRYQRNLWTRKMVKISGPFYEKIFELER